MHDRICAKGELVHFSFISMKTEYQYNACTLKFKKDILVSFDWIIKCLESTHTWQVAVGSEWNCMQLGR